MRICDLLGVALNGKTAVIRGADITCNLARYVLGVDEPSEKVRASLTQQLLAWGVANADIAAQILESLPRLPLGDKLFIFGPINGMISHCDVTLWVGPPSAAMERVIQLAYTLGVRTQGDLNGVAGVCGECSARVLQKHGSSLSMGCRGSRPHAGLDSDELLHATSGTLLRKLEVASDD